MYFLRRAVCARPRVVRAVRRCAVRAAKAAIADALRADDAITALVPTEQIFTTERATLPVLPAIELLVVSSERTDRPLIQHVLSCEITVSSPTEDGADEALDRIVTAIRARLSSAESESDPIVLEDGSVALVELRGVRWSVSATADNKASIVRGAAIGLAVAAVDEAGGHDDY